MGLKDVISGTPETARYMAQQHLTRAEQLDREGKFCEANRERAKAARYEKVAAKAERKQAERSPAT